MTTHPLHALFERIFGDGETVDADARARKGGITGLDVHSLATEIEHHPHGGPVPLATEIGIAKMAAWLDNGLDESAMEDFNARMAQSPELLEDASSAEAFLDAAKMLPQIAPPTLVQAVIEAGERPRANLSAPSHRAWFAWWKLSGIALAMAAAVIAAIIMISPSQSPTDQKAPMTAGQVPRSDGAAVPGTKEPGLMPSPSLAGKAGVPEGMAPAASEETMPIQGSQRGKIAP